MSGSAINAIMLVVFATVEVGIWCVTLTHILMSRLDGVEKLLWVLVIWKFGIIGIALYAVLGIPRAKAAARRRAFRASDGAVAVQALHRMNPGRTGGQSYP